MALGKSEWAGAAAYLTIAAFVPLLRPLTMFGRELLLVVYKDRLLIAYTLLNLLSLGGLGYWLVNTERGALGMAIASYFPLGTLVLAWGLHGLAPQGVLEPDSPAARALRPGSAVLRRRSGWSRPRKPGFVSASPWSPPPSSWRSRPGATETPTPASGTMTGMPSNRTLPEPRHESDAALLDPAKRRLAQ